MTGTLLVCLRCGQVNLFMEEEVLYMREDGINDCLKSFYCPDQEPGLWLQLFFVHPLVPILRILKGI